PQPASRCCHNDTAPTSPHPLSLHDALPISSERAETEKEIAALDELLGQIAAAAPDAEPIVEDGWSSSVAAFAAAADEWSPDLPRSEEHTSELQSRENLVCRLLLEKKKDNVR